MIITKSVQKKKKNTYMLSRKKLNKYASNTVYFTAINIINTEIYNCTIFYIYLQTTLTNFPLQEFALLLHIDISPL